MGAAPSDAIVHALGDLGDVGLRRRHLMDAHTLAVFLEDGVDSQEMGPKGKRNIPCRTGALGRMASVTLAATSHIRRAPQLGHRPRCLQLKATRTSWRHAFREPARASSAQGHRGGAETRRASAKNASILESEAFLAPRTRQFWRARRSWRHERVNFPERSLPGAKNASISQSGAFLAPKKASISESEAFLARRRPSALSSVAFLVSRCHAPFLSRGVLGGRGLRGRHVGLGGLSSGGSDARGHVLEAWSTTESGYRTLALAW